MQQRHLIDLDRLPIPDMERIIALADKIRKNPAQYSEACRGKIMATLFYEPSTRTQMSFKTAMLRLGGQVIGFDNPENSSVAKGESLKDTIRVISGYADVIVIRHPKEGAAEAASMFSRAPVINAGDGGHLHPTQTLTDVVTLFREKGRLDHLHIGLCGDLKNGRTVHSLIKTMLRYPGNRFVLISTPELGLPQYVKDALNAAGCPYEEAPGLQGAIPKLDVLYMTRIQKERFSSPEEYEKQKGVFVLDTKKLSLAKTSLKILHPLPRVDEITVEVDEDPRAVYFEQTEYGVYARMALVLLMLEDSERRLSPAAKQTHVHCCKNPRCITQAEPYLPKRFTEAGDMLVCEYCEQRQLI